MADREKVIKGLECCGGISSAYECPYQGSEGCDNCRGNIYLDALSLLKAQEAAEPYIDFDGRDVWRCGSCGATLFHLSHTQADENKQNCVKFCRYCGRAVKWE